MSSKVADVWSAHTGFSIIGWIEGKIDFWLHSLLWRWEKFGRLCNGQKSTYKRQPWAARGIQMEDCIEIQNPNVIEIQVKHCCVEISMNWNGEEVVSGGWGLDGVSANSQRHPKNPLELSIGSFHCCWSSLAVPDLWSLWKLCDVPDWGYNLNQDLKHGESWKFFSFLLVGICHKMGIVAGWYLYISLHFIINRHDDHDHCDHHRPKWSSSASTVRKFLHLPSHFLRASLPVKIHTRWLFHADQLLPDFSASFLFISSRNY